MYKPITMDARRVDALSSQITGLRFFHQLPAHLIPRFLQEMTVHRLPAESLVFKENDLGDSFCVIMKGTIAVYARKKDDAALTAAAAKKAEEEKQHDPLARLIEGGDVDPSAPNSARDGEADNQPASSSSDAKPAPRKRRHFQSATAGSISVPNTVKVNPATGSISLPSNYSKTSLEPPPPAPVEHTFSLVVNPNAKPLPSSFSTEPQQRGVSLLPGWVTPPSSEEDDDSDEKQSDIEEGSESEPVDDGLTPEERAAKAAAIVEQARQEARARLEAEEAKRLADAAEAERLAVIAEEEELQRLEAREARAEMQCLTTLTACDSFGLLTILESTKRAATLIAIDDTELACLTRTQYESLMKELNMTNERHPKPRCHIPSFSKYLRILRMPSELREDSQLNYLINPLLANNRILQMLDQRSLQLVASAMKILTIPKSGIVLQKQGEEGEWMYVVLKGSISEHAKPVVDLPPPVVEVIEAPTKLSPRYGATRRTQRSPSPTRRRAHSPSTARGRGITFLPPAVSQTIISPAPSPAGAGPETHDILSAYGPCTRLLLTGDLSPFPDPDIQHPTFWSKSPCTLLTREPCVLAKISVDYFSHLMLGCNKPLKGSDNIREALLANAPHRRSELQLEVLDAVLKNVTFFQFKPPALRKTLCARMVLKTFKHPGNSVIFHQGQASDAFYIILSGSVSIHQLAHKEAVDWDPSVTQVHPSIDILTTFGPCLSIGRAGAHFGDQSLISTLPRNMTILTRGPCELISISRKDYMSVFIPVADEMQYHASKALQLLSRPTRSQGVITQLIDVLKHVPFFADLPVNLRTFAIRHMEVDTVEGDTVIFCEDDEADYLYVIMSGSVGVHIHDKKQKELLKQAKLESQTSADQALQLKRQLEKEQEALNKQAAVSREIAAEELEEEFAKTEDELLAEQMQRDAEKEVERLMAEKAAAKKLAEKGQGDSDSEDSEEESSSDEESEDEEDSRRRRSLSNAGAPALPTAAAARLQSSSRGDVFTASGAGQYALARKLRSNSASGGFLSSVAGSGAGVDSMVALRSKETKATDFAKRLHQKNSSSKGSMQEIVDELQEGGPAPEPDEMQARLERQLSSGLLQQQHSTDNGRVQCGHLTAAERTEQYGPCVVQLPSGSVVGEVALTNAGQRNKRTATIITMEPTFFIRLHGDVVSRLTFGRAGAGTGSMTQDAMANFLKTLDILRIVKGSQTGAGTGSHATFKRLAYHMKDRKLASGVKVIEQGTKADSVFFIVSGSILMTRHVLCNGIKQSSGGVGSGVAKRVEKFNYHPQLLGEQFQRVDTSYLPEPQQEYTPPTAVTATPAIAPAPAAANPATGVTAPPPPPPVVSTIPTVPIGLPLHVDLTVVGMGELIGGLEAFTGSIHSSSFVVTSADCVVLQMKRNHFLNLFPQRALEQVKWVSEQRSKIYAQRVEKFITMRCKQLHPLHNLEVAPPPEHPSKITGKFEEIHEEDYRTQLPSNTPFVFSKEPQLSGSSSHKVLRPMSAVTAAVAQSTPNKQRPTTASSTSAPSSFTTTNSLASPGHGTYRKTGPGEPDLANVVQEVEAIEDLSSSAAHRASAAITPSVKRAPVLAPVTPKVQVLQSLQLMHTLNLVPSHEPPPLTSVQMALGYKEEPAIPTISWAEQEGLTPKKKLAQIRPYTSHDTRQLRTNASAPLLPTTERPNTTQTAREFMNSDEQVPSNQRALTSQSSAELGAELSVSSILERQAAESEAAAEARRVKRGSIKIGGGSKLGGVEYVSHQPNSSVPTSQELQSYSNTLMKETTGGIIGFDDVLDTKREQAEDKQHLLNVEAATPLPVLNHGRTISNGAGSTSSPIVHEDVNDKDMDVEKRAIILMRAERAQLAWESGETKRRGHKIMDKLRPTSYNISQEEKQQKLSRSLAWDSVQRGDPSQQSNAFIHSASPPLAVMNSIDLKQRPGSSGEGHQREPSTFDEPLDLSIEGLEAMQARANAEKFAAFGAPTRVLSAKKTTKPPSANLSQSTSPFIRSLLTPLVDNSFTSLFATATVAGGADSSPFFITQATVGGVSPGRGHLTRAISAKKLTIRPSTAGQMGRSSSQANIRSPTSAATTARKSARAAAVMSPSQYDTPEKSYPLFRYAESSLPSDATQSWTDIPNGDTSSSTTPHRVNSSGVERSNSAASLRSPSRLSAVIGSKIGGQTPTTTDPEAIGVELAQQHRNLTPLVSPSQRVPTSSSSSSNSTPAAASAAAAAIASNISPIRHTRTSSLGSFMRLTSAGVERQMTSVVSPTSPSASLLSPATTIPEDVNEEEKESTDHGGMISVKSAASSSRPELGARQPSLACFSPATYQPANATAFTKQSFKDERAAATLFGTQVIRDSHQSIYSHSRTQALLPGTKNNPTGADALTKEEMEALRRKKLYSFAAPKIVPDQPTAFSTVMSMSENLPDKLLAPSNSLTKKRSRLDELRVAKATKEGGLASKILFDFKQASERAPM